MITNPYLKDVNRCLTPVYIPGERYSFYLNFDQPITDPDFNNFSLLLIKNDTIVVSGVGPLQKHVVKGSTLYNIYCDFTFPDIAPGQYQFVIYDTVKSLEKCRSNVIICVTEDYDEIAQRLVYFDSENIYNYYYSLLPNFKNRFRLPLAKIEYQFESERTQYRNVSDNKFRNLRSYRDILYKIESYNFDENAHRAISCVYEHENIFLSNVGITPKDGYQVATNQIASLTKGTIDAYENGLILDEFFEGGGFDLIIDAGTPPSDRTLLLISNIF